MLSIARKTSSLAQVKDGLLQKERKWKVGASAKRWKITQVVHLENPRTWVSGDLRKQDENKQNDRCRHRHLHTRAPAEKKTL